jgi:glycine betaine/proline transport system ATP-binding protein
MFNSGVPKNEILEKTGCAIGTYDASFDVYEGETVVVMGLSGSGKSTLVRCVNRLYEPTAGKIIIDDVDVTKLNPEELRKLRQQKFGMVFQRFALLPHRTIVDNAAFGMELAGFEVEERREKAREALELVGLQGWENMYPDQLSGGMQQRVGIARALAVDPDILLMDEAFSALDPLIRSDMQDELLALEARVKKTILFITHDLDEALKIGDRIVLMKDARIVQIGTPEDILMRPASEYVKRFVENVDRAKVLTAKDVMVKAAAITYPKDGPRTALHTMRERGISSIFVVDRDRKLKGIVSADKADEAEKGKEKTLESILEHYDENVVGPDTPVQEIFPVIAESRYPIAVVDDDKRFLGMIVRGSIIAGLSEGGEGEENGENSEKS